MRKKKTLTVSALQKQSWQNAEDNGFHNLGRTFGDEIALVHSELSEALEAYRIMPTGIAQWLPETKPGEKPEGVASELADVVIRVADMAECHNINLEKAVLEKLAYNRTRPYRHGGKKL